MQIDPAAIRLLVALAAASRDELCGVLLGRRGPPIVEQLIEGRNVDRTPRRRYLLDAATLLRADAHARASGLTIVGFYHSHPGGPAIPSLADRGAMWPGYVYLIAAVSGPAPYACAWVLSERGLAAEPIYCRSNEQ